MPSENLIERALWAAAVHKAALAGLGIAPGCEQLLKSFIRTGGKRLTAEDHLADPDYLALAEANLQVFVAHMIIEARKQGMSDLHEGTFETAKKTLCPLWPFC